MCVITWCRLGWTRRRARRENNEARPSGVGLSVAARVRLQAMTLLSGEGLPDQLRLQSVTDSSIKPPYEF
jgi:hypothetical protein